MPDNLEKKNYVDRWMSPQHESFKGGPVLKWGDSTERDLSTNVGWE